MGSSPCFYIRDIDRRGKSLRFNAENMAESEREVFLPTASHGDLLTSGQSQRLSLLFYLEYSAGICYNEHKMPMPIQAYATYAWQQIERSGAHDGYAGLSVSFQHAESSV